MRCRYPWPLKVVRFVQNSLSFDQLNIPCADIPCVLGNGVGGDARSTQPVTLYITVNIASSTKNSCYALDHADKAMKRIDRSDAWERAVGRIKWVMDTLGPIAVVRVTPF